MQKTVIPDLNKSFVSHLFSQGEYYRQLIDNLPVAIYTCDKEGFILFYNKAAASLWGREPEIGKDLWCGSWKIYYPDGSHVSLDDCPMAVTLKEGKSVRGIEIVIERPDGVKLNVLPHPDPIFDKDGNQVGAVNMLVDITEHKRTKETNLLLKDYNSQLEQFAYAASHDMQEPLRKIHTFSNLLTERTGDKLDEQSKHYLTRITQSAGRMHSIIQDLLDYSRQTRLDDKFKPTDLNQIICNIESDLELMITAKNATIHVDQLPVIRSIPSQMNRLFYNLIQNSLKFSRQNSAPHISITISNNLTSDNGKNLFEIIIADNGIGFDQKYSDKIFNLFQRLNDKQSYGGNGIGLALCKKIVDNHQGQISAESQPDTGTKFYLRFPVDLIEERV